MESSDPFEFYITQSEFTDPKDYEYLFQDLPTTIPELCEIVHGVISHRDSSELYDIELTEQRKNEGETRYLDLILKRIIELDNKSLLITRPPIKRFAGTCRDFAILLCSILRYQKTPARLRCGYAGYFKEGRYEDHWVCEYWNKEKSRWTLVDAEVDNIYKKYFKMTLDVTDVPRDQFLVGGQAWKACRSGQLDPNTFGVSSIGIQGIGLVRGNVLRDLASLNHVELLPWDDWPLSDKKFDELTEEEIAIINNCANCAIPEVDNFKEIRKLYQTEQVKVPEIIKSYTTYNGIKSVPLRNYH